ncbi:MAG: homoserine kinase [Cyanobacteria bacterium HKST-UBA04]|nr:homoserine kinase [Cyanobacteria bacterium HKST-UBA04]
MANLGPGFDTLGMAVSMHNLFEAHPCAEPGLTLEWSSASSVSADGISFSPQENLLANAYSHYFQLRNQPVPNTKLVIESHIPLSRGLGSSSTAIVGGLSLARTVMGERFSPDALVHCAVELEGHPDNVVPALLGNIRCCSDQFHTFELKWPEAWGLILVIPSNKVDTHQTRQALPNTYLPVDMVTGIRHMAAWIHGVQTADDTLLRQALSGDVIHEVSRGPLIPEFGDLKAWAESDDIAHKVLGVFISGSGSTCGVVVGPFGNQKKLLADLKQRFSHCTVEPVRVEGEGVKLVPVGAGIRPAKATKP